MVSLWIRRRPQHLSCGALACIQAPASDALDCRSIRARRKWVWHRLAKLAGAAGYRSGKPAGGPAWP